MMRKLKKISLFVAVLTCLQLCKPIQLKAATVKPKIVVTSITVELDGYTRVVGYISGADKNAQVTYLVTTQINNTEIVYIDQKACGNNGAFYFTHGIQPKYSKNIVKFKIGSNTGADTWSFIYSLPDIPPGIEHVENNSVMYGMDVYSIPSVYLNATYVTDSLFNGGNVIYYKFDDHWYDLLDEKATSTAYLLDTRYAVSDDVMKALPVRYYYYGARRVDFKNAD